MGLVYFDKHVRESPFSRIEEKVEAILKIISLFGVAIVMSIVLIVRSVFYPTKIEKQKEKVGFGKVELIVPYKSTLYENFGFVNDPRIKLPLKTKDGYVDTVFLLDSGAVVSALPLKAANVIGIDLLRSKRITLQGFSGIPSFAYLDSITVKIGGEDFQIPAVFTESNSTSYILGRKGFFDGFSIEFDNIKKAIIISKR